MIEINANISCLPRRYENHIINIKSKNEYLTYDAFIKKVETLYYGINPKLLYSGIELSTISFTFSDGDNETMIEYAFGSVPEFIFTLTKDNEDQAFELLKKDMDIYPEEYIIESQRLRRFKNFNELIEEYVNNRNK